MLLYASLSVADGLGKGFVVPTARTYLVRLQRFSAVQNPLNDLFLTHLIRTWKEKKKPYRRSTLPKQASLPCPVNNNPQLHGGFFRGSRAEI